MEHSVIQDSASLLSLSPISLSLSHISVSVSSLCLASPASAPLPPGYGAPLVC